MTDARLLIQLRRVRRATRAAVLAALSTTMFAMAGCAPLPAAPGSAPVPPASGIPVPGPTRVETRREPAPAAVVRDSTPSADAVRVLATIAEPLSPSQRVSAPQRPGGTITVPAPEAAYDTLRVQREPEPEAENGDAAVPVPSPTQPLGNNPSGGLTMPDTLTLPPPAASRPGTAPPLSTGAASTPGAAAKPASGECWRLQVSAPEEKDMAESRQAAAQSLLLVPMVIEFEKGLHKVRTRDCMTREAADAVRKRAEDSGFAGSFVLNSAAVAAPATKPSPKPSPARTTPKKKPRR